MSRSLGDRSLTMRPPMAISPPVIVSRPAIMFNRVDLPHPDGPTRMRNSPSGASMLMPFNTWTGPKRLTTLRIESAPMSALDGAGREAAQEILAGKHVDQQRGEAGDD